MMVHIKKRRKLIMLCIDCLFFTELIDVETKEQWTPFVKEHDLNKTRSATHVNTPEKKERRAELDVNTFCFIVPFHATNYNIVSRGIFPKFMKILLEVLFYYFVTSKLIPLGKHVEKS